MKRRAKVLLTFAVFIASLFSAGCAAILRGTKQKVSIDSNVPGAEILINDKKIGVTPFVGRIPRGVDTTLVVRKRGYRTRTMVLNSSVEPIFFGNIFFFAIGSVTDYLIDSMYKYAGTIQVDLYPVAPLPR